MPRVNSFRLDGDHRLDRSSLLSGYPQQQNKKGHRIRSLHQSFSTFDFGPAAKGYSNSSIEEEFPRSADGNLTFNHTLRDLTLDCIDASKFEVSLEKESFLKYLRLVDVTRVLRNSQFLNELISDSNLLNSEPKEKSGRLKRRLDKVFQYYRTRRLINMVKRWFPKWKYFLPLSVSLAPGR